MEAVKEKRRSKPKKTKQKKEIEERRDVTPVTVTAKSDDDIQIEGACGGPVTETKPDTNTESKQSKNIVDQKQVNVESLSVEDDKSKTEEIRDNSEIAEDVVDTENTISGDGEAQPRIDALTKVDVTQSTETDNEVNARSEFNTLDTGQLNRDKEKLKNLNIENTIQISGDIETNIEVKSDSTDIVSGQQEQVDQNVDKTITSEEQYQPSNKEIEILESEAKAIGHDTAEINNAVQGGVDIEKTVDTKLYPDISQQLQSLDREKQKSNREEQMVESTAPQESDLIHDDQAKLARERADRLVLEEKEKERIQPLTVEQLNSLYHNDRLESNSDFINKFVESELKRESPEFYEILLNYQRARRNLLQTEAALTSLEQRYKELERELWITETKTQTAKGVCGDNARCQKTITYEQARLNDTARNQLAKILANIQEEIHQNLCLHSYSSLLSKLQVESYIHNLIVTSPAVYELPRNVPVQGCERYSSGVAHQVTRLKSCISVLFYFHRTPIEDEEMLSNLQIWTERLVSPLLRIGSFEDHLFILNQIMRCPGGIGTWAASFVQAPPIPDCDNLNLAFGNPCFDHMITALSTVLIPTSARGDFLCHMQKMFTPSGDKKSISWVMVDEDGEEDEDPQNAWVYLHENDIVAVLKQLPLAAIFRHIFFVSQSPYNDTYEYSIEKTAEATMYRVYAFCTCLVRLFGTGLRTYNMTRYRQLNKRLGRKIRQIVQYVSDHWGNFRDANQNLLPHLSVKRLQLEFDSFFLRAVDFIHTAQRLGSWQFIAEMPFKNISKETMWKLLWLLYQSHGQSVDVVNIPPVEQCMAFVQDSAGLSQLADLLQHIPASEGIYLLNTMTNMTESCSSADLDLIETITTAVFEVSYICPQTRDACSKMGRELLSAVVKCHPFLLSKILHSVHDNMEKLGPMGLYLYKGLPLNTWLPSDPDILILRQWLLNSPLGSHTHMLSQLILSNINWDKSKQGDSLMVPWRVHKQVAVLVVEAYHKVVMGKHLGSVIMEGVKQMSAAVQQYSTTEQEFNSWCWDTLIKLTLHRSSLPSADQRMAEMFQQVVLDLNKDDFLLPLIKGNKENNATACFVTLMLTRFGHSEAEFLSDGIPLLQTLVDQGLSKPIICILQCVIPMFTDIQTHLLENSRFQMILFTLLQSDESYFKAVKGLLSYEFPGPITKLLTSMIMSQVDDARAIHKDKMLPIIELWVQLLMKWPRWYQDRNYCYVLDQLLGVSFSYQPTMDGIQTILQGFYKQFCDDEKNQGVVSSFVNWVTSGTYLPTFLDKTSCPEFPWLAHMLLCLEGNYELDTKLWANMQQELTASPKMGVDHALKKAKNKLKLDQAPTFHQLSLYRFAQQALDMPIDHPVAVLTWQRFFILFLGRLDPSTQQTDSQRGSVGEKFLSGLSYSSMRKKLKKRLKEASDWFLACTANINTASEEERYKRDRLNKLTRMYQTFQLWVEEPLLHDSSLYLPSLPPQYMADRLLVVFQKNMSPWLEFIDTLELEDSMVTMASQWRQSKDTDQSSGSSTDRKEVVIETGKERILSRLHRCDRPLPPPPVHPVSAPVADVSPAILEDKTSLLHLIQADMEMLKQHAGQFCSMMTRQETLDDKYTRLIPILYKNIPKEKVVSLECTSMINPLHSCSKPGSAVLKYHEKWNSPIEQRQADDNRADYRQLMVTNKLPPPYNIVISAVHTENTITMLVKLYRNTTDEKKLKNINDIACTIFFRLGDTIDRNIQTYPPTQQFFTSCMDVLGQNFIQKDPLQVDLLLQLAIRRPELGGLFSPHFLPNINNVMFYPMYNMLLTTMKKQRLELTFMLLTKFDVKKWLVEHSPVKEEVKKFIQTLGQALCMCDVGPNDQFKLVFDVYIGHEKMILQHRFPLNIHEVLAALLQGSSIEKLSVKCWTVFHGICFYGNNPDQPTQAEGENSSNVYTDLSTEQITNLIQWLGHELMQTRLNTKDSTTFGLYPQWKRYVPHIAQLLKDLSKCLVDKMMPLFKESTTNDSIESAWRCIVEGFGPWLQAVYVSQVPGMPWIEADRETATHMVKALRDVVRFAHYKTLELRGKFYNDFLSMLWLYFATTLCKVDVTPSVVSVLNMEFQQLPWKQLCPNIQVMETFAQLKGYGSSLGFNLVSDIISTIDWPQVSSWYAQYHSVDINSRYEGCLFVLLIQACAEKKFIENPDMEQLLSQAESFRWQNVSGDVYRKSCSMFLHDGDSKCILQGRTSPDGLGLRLLKSASGFNTEMSQGLTEDWTSKRLCYLHTVSSLICQCTFLPDWQPAALKTLIVNLLTEIETVESAVLDVYTQHQECADMVKEILTLLNNCNPDNQGSEVVMETWLDWLKDSPQTVLLSPCIHAATRSVASLTSMVQIVELCIELSFIPGGQRKIMDPWASVMAALQIPELNVTDFFKVCLQESSFLLMHCYTLQRLPLCQNLIEEQGLIETILDWTERTKPSADNESKLLLWWYKVLDLILRQMNFGRETSTCVTLLKKFTHNIQIFGEDRMSGGLLGAIGFGKRSILSEKFRLCSRAVVAFISQQILSDTKLRVDRSTAMSTLPAAKQDLAALLSLKSNKKYQPIKLEVETLCGFVTNQSKCLSDVLLLVKTLRTCFYSEKTYLAVIDSIDM